MPPKKAPNKNDVKKAQKKVEDKTFGMKNKKGANAKKAIATIQANTVGNMKAQQAKANKGSGPSKKEIKAQKEAELKALGFKVADKKTPAPGASGPAGGANQKQEGEPIVEKKKEKTLEEVIEELRTSLKGPLTPVNKDTFEAWKAKKQREAELENMQAAAKRAEELKHGKAKHTGRELMNFRPELFVDDDAADETLEREGYVDPPVDPLELEGGDDEPATTSSAAAAAPTPDADTTESAIADGDEGYGEEEDGEGEDGGEDEDGEEHKVAIDESLFTDENIPDDE